MINGLASDILWYYFVRVFIRHWPWATKITVTANEQGLPIGDRAERLPCRGFFCVAATWHQKSDAWREGRRCIERPELFSWWLMHGVPHDKRWWHNRWLFCRFGCDILFQKAMMRQWWYRCGQCERLERYHLHESYIMQKAINVIIYYASISHQWQSISNGFSICASTILFL